MRHAKRAVVARDIDGLNKLVDKHSDDWEQIGREMGTVPNIAKESGARGQHSKRSWTVDDDTRLRQLAASYENSSIDWLAIGGQLGRSGAACRIKYHRKQELGIADPLQGHVDATNQEVQRQLSQGLQVDWAQLSQAVGLDVLKCLEVCQVDNGKAR
ncbi:hypothetical protein LPJ61_000358 [Coemansia biformis]|uniref:Myb-like domain-containing protein n=1 Tax=Coemansia biformis TaxID=1286918 RepID=A0A9W7YIU8_9FUNG|nr:hypothetical protein LPJ61_000358 [Coemansia biformis]